MKTLPILLLSCCVSSLAGYSAKSTATFPAASGSTQTSITLEFILTDSKLRSVASGGVIASSSTRTGVLVPNDLVFTNDSTCASITGSYTWDVTYWESSATGIVRGHILIASLTTGASVTPIVCIGLASDTWHGGAVGAAYDTNTRACWYMPNGTTLSMKDFCGSGLDWGNTTGVTAGAGLQVGGASVWAGVQWSSAATTSIATNVSVQAWVKSSTLTSQNGFILSKAPVGSNWAIFIEAGVLKIRDNGSQDLTFAAPSNNTWHQVSGTWAGTNAALYIDGASVNTRTGVAIGNGAGGLLLGAFAAATSSYNFSGSMGTIILSATNRSANWIATQYANQLSPATAAAFTSLATATSQVLVF